MYEEIDIYTNLSSFSRMNTCAYHLNSIYSVRSCCQGHVARRLASHIIFIVGRLVVDANIWFLCQVVLPLLDGYATEPFVPARDQSVI
jgi:hypothetical protein